MNTKTKIISHDAPKGHIAVAHTDGICENCAFKYDSLCPNVRGIHSCVPAKRKDGQMVVFVKTPT